MYKAITRINTTPIAILKIVITTIHHTHSFNNTCGPESLNLVLPNTLASIMHATILHRLPILYLLLPHIIHVLIVTVSFDVSPTLSFTCTIWSSLSIIHGTFLYIKQSGNHLHHILILLMPFHTTILDDALIEGSIPNSHPGTFSSRIAVESMLILRFTG